MPSDDLPQHALDPDYLPLKWVPPTASPAPPADDLPNWDVSKVRESFERHADYLFTELDNIALTREPTATDAGESILLSQHEVHLLVARTVFVAFYVLKLGLCVYEHADTENGNKHAINNSFLHRAGSNHLVTACDALYTILSLITNVPRATTDTWKKEKPSIYVPAGMFTCLPRATHGVHPPHLGDPALSLFDKLPHQSGPRKASATHAKKRVQFDAVNSGIYEGDSVTLVDDGPKTPTPCKTRTKRKQPASWGRD